jgi:hypothetical protein
MTAYDEGPKRRRAMARISGRNVSEIYGHMNPVIRQRFTEFFKTFWESGVELDIKEMARYRSAQINECVH